jgi:release factor glutamine methyltransferase
VCTGSGCIAVSLVKHLPNASCVGVDVSESALELAAENGQKLGANATWVQSDVLQNKWEPKEWAINSFDFWVSNPPYVEVSEKRQLSKAVLNYEPHLALFAPADDPLLFYLRIAQSAAVFLRSGGYLYFELNEFNAPNASLLMEEIGFVNIEMRKDLQGKSRMIRAQKR